MSTRFEDIRSILNRIDGVNAPVEEKRDNTDIDIRKLLVDISSMKDRIGELGIDDDAKTSALTALGQVEDDIAQEIQGSFPEEESYKGRGCCSLLYWPSLVYRARSRTGGLVD